MPVGIFHKFTSAILNVPLSSSTLRPLRNFISFSAVLLLVILSVDLTRSKCHVFPLTSNCLRLGHLSHPPPFDFPPLSFFFLKPLQDARVVQLRYRPPPTRPGGFFFPRVFFSMPMIAAVSAANPMWPRFAFGPLFSSAHEVSVNPRWTWTLTQVPFLPSSPPFVRPSLSRCMAPRLHACSFN